MYPSYSPLRIPYTAAARLTELEVYGTLSAEQDVEPEPEKLPEYVEWKLDGGVIVRVYQKEEADTLELGAAVTSARSADADTLWSITEQLDNRYYAQALYTLRMTDELGEEINADGRMIRVYLPLPGGHGADRYEVACVDDYGAELVLSSVMDGYAVVETQTLRSYAVVYANGADVGGVDTGVEAPAWCWILAAVCTPAGFRGGGAPPEKAAGRVRKRLGNTGASFRKKRRYLHNGDGKNPQREKVDDMAVEQQEFLTGTEAVRFFGRTDAGVQPGRVYFNWSGSGFSFSFTGTAAYARLHTASEGERPFPEPERQAWIGVYADGGEEAVARFSLDRPDGWYTLVQGLAGGAAHAARGQAYRMRLRPGGSFRTENGGDAGGRADAPVCAPTGIHRGFHHLRLWQYLYHGFPGIYHQGRGRQPYLRLFPGPSAGGGNILRMRLRQRYFPRLWLRYAQSDAGAVSIHRYHAGRAFGGGAYALGFQPVCAPSDRYQAGRQRQPVLRRLGFARRSRAHRRAEKGTPSGIFAAPPGFS